MAEFKERYGIPGTDINSLNRRWNRIKHDCTWNSFDEFLVWCARNDYQRGLQLTKRLKSMPHGPQNSILVPLSEFMRALRAENTIKVEVTESEFCKGCTRKCSGNGCAEYKKWFCEQWDTKFHRDIPKPVVVDFRYEHPDLVREGIVWQG